MASSFDFVEVVVADRDLVVTTAHDHACRLEPRDADLSWFCDLDDGTPTGESDPAASVRWVCPELRVGGTEREPAVPQLEVSRPGPHSDLGRLLKGFGQLLRGSDKDAAGEAAKVRFLYTDPAGVVDDSLRQRIEHWPLAMHGDGVVRPAELWSVKRTGEGLVVTSVSWWGSAPALDHQIRLAEDIAHRLADVDRQL